MRRGIDFKLAIKIEELRILSHRWYCWFKFCAHSQGEMVLSVQDHTNCKSFFSVFCYFHMFKNFSLMRRLILTLFCAVTITAMSTVTFCADETFVGRLALVVKPEVASQLELSDEVKTKLNKLIDDRENAANDLAFQIKKLSSEEQAAKLSAFQAESESLGLKLLSETQVKKLEQIQWRRRGPLSFGDKDIANKLLFNPKQIDDISGLVEEYKAATGKVPPQTLPGLKSQFERKILEVLNDKQRSTWENLTGNAATSLAKETGSPEKFDAAKVEPDAKTRD